MSLPRFTLHMSILSGSMFTLALAGSAAAQSAAPPPPPGPPPPGAAPPPPGPPPVYGQGQPATPAYGPPGGGGYGPAYGPPPPGYDAPAAAPSGPNPPARVGFQMALRTGYAIPFGKIADGNGFDMSDRVSGQVPFFVEIGGKPHENIFVGGYLGLGFGGVAGSVKDACNRANASCSVVGVRLGVEIQYHILPDQMANPWIGYGIGYESLAESVSASGNDGTDSVSGFEFAHLMAGVDFRINRVFGLGPFLDFSMGTYSNEHVTGSGNDNSASIPQTAGHQWLALGVRGVFFP